MGSDGAAGLRDLRRGGGITIIQEEASCMIWGMPKAAAQLQAAAYELSPTQIARAMMEMARQ
jgi:two-component system chemotaxis response regulator CheB